MSRTAWFAPPLPRILAHRGLALEAPQNSVDSFLAALEAGATHLETDVRATADGIAVLVHDAALADGSPVARLPLTALRRRLPAVATLAEALAAVPTGRFNVDVKALGAVAPTVAAIREAGAAARVLLASFSLLRRRPAVHALPGIATSGSATDVLAAVVARRLGRAALQRALAGLDALQVPQHALRTDLAAPPFLRAVHEVGVEVHIWVVNEPEQMLSLVAAGVDGIVTDRPDLAAATLR